MATWQRRQHASKSVQIICPDSFRNAQKGLLLKVKIFNKPESHQVELQLLLHCLSRLAYDYELCFCTCWRQAELPTCRKLVDETLKAFDKIDILVNNASMQEDLLDSFTGRASILQSSSSLQTPNSANHIQGANYSFEGKMKRILRAPLWKASIASCFAPQSEVVLPLEV